MLTCQFCGETGTTEDDLQFQLDKYGRGFWCESCDGYTYLSETVRKHRFTLILEDKTQVLTRKVTSLKKFRKQLSPLRYPGGKQKLIDYLYTHLQDKNTFRLVSPFTGGGSFELAMLDAGVVKELHLNDLDFGIYSLWWTILHAPYELLDKLHTYTPTHSDYFYSQILIKEDFQGATVFDAAWATLVVNRLAYSGIAKANPLGGKNGSKKALLSRWNPATLEKRINNIASLSDRIRISNIDANELIEEAYWDDSNTIFIDPPYVEKGKQLYNHFYTKHDHARLAMLLDSLHHGMPGADIIVTYDHNEWLYRQYDFPETHIIGSQYSI